MPATLTDYRTLSNAEIISALVGREVFYLAESSKINSTCQRHFKIVDVENVAIAAKTGVRYVTAKVIDHDCGGTETHKNLQLRNLSLI